MEGNINKIDTGPFGLDQFDTGCYLANPDNEELVIDFDLRAASKYIRDNNLDTLTDEIKKLFPKL